MPPVPSTEECRYIALQIEKGGYDGLPPPKEVDLLAAAEFRLLVQQALSSYRPGPSRRWRIGIAGALRSNERHFSGLQGMAVSNMHCGLALCFALLKHGGGKSNNRMRPRLKN